jgi:hypothetical protein
VEEKVEMEIEVEVEEKVEATPARLQRLHHPLQQVKVGSMAAPWAHHFGPVGLSVPVSPFFLLWSTPRFLARRHLIVVLTCLLVQMWSLLVCMCAWEVACMAATLCGWAFG